MREPPKNRLRRFAQIQLDLGLQRGALQKIDSTHGPGISQRRQYFSIREEQGDHLEVAAANDQIPVGASAAVGASKKVVARYNHQQASCPYFWLFP